MDGGCANHPGRVHSVEYYPETGWDQMPKHIVRLDTDTEFYGIGESGRGLPIEQVREGAGKLLGRDPETITLQRIYDPPAHGTEGELEVGRGPAYDVFETALFDLIGRVRQLPVHALLGGAVRSRVRADYWMGHLTPEDGKKAVERALKHGFKSVKIKCRIEDPMFERLQAMREVGGPEFKVTVDPNERFHTAEQTIELAQQLEPLGNVEVFEDPIPKADIEGYEKIHAAIPFHWRCIWVMDTRSSKRFKPAPAKGSSIASTLAATWSAFSATPLSPPPLICPAGTDRAVIWGFWTPPTSMPPPPRQIAPWPPILSAAGRGRMISSSSRSISWTGFVPTPMKPGLGCELDYDAMQRFTEAFEEIQ